LVIVSPLQFVGGQLINHSGVIGERFGDSVTDNMMIVVRIINRFRMSVESTGQDGGHGMNVSVE
jgi:hypothetical protein